MVRPTKHDRRDRQLNIKLTMGELCRVRERAAEAGMRPTDFGRAQLLSERPLRESVEAPDSTADRLRLAQLSRLGNNLNQVARRLNELRLPAPADLAPLLRNIRRAMVEGTRDDH